MHWFETGQNKQEDLAARAFLRALKELRTPFLQDAPPWRRLHPDLYIFRNDLFQDPEYLEFERMALARTTTNESVYDHRLVQAWPLLVEELQKRDNAVMHQLGDIATAINLSTTMTISTQEKAHALHSLVATIHKALSRPMWIPGPLQPPDQALGVPRSPSLDLPNQRAFEPTTTGSSIPLMTPYRMDRNVVTVKDLWTEYTLGLNGRASICSQYDGDDQSWKKGNDAERKFYSRRAPIWKLVQSIADARRMTPAEAVVVVENQRMKLPSKSLNALSDWIKNASAEEIVLM